MMMNKMKKLMVLFLIGISCIGLMGASIWEGAAAMAAGGELPENGFYIATNSFPRNTMVDVVNLENGKTLRAIVVGGIDAPGLLGILSKEAAAALGLEKGVVGRIRVNMPSDPIAFSRYTDELAKNGDPDRDPAAALSLATTEAAQESNQTSVVENKETTPAEPVQGTVDEKKEEVQASPITSGAGPAVEQSVDQNQADQIVQETTIQLTAVPASEPEVAEEQPVEDQIKELPEVTQQTAPVTEEITPEVPASEKPEAIAAESPETSVPAETVEPAVETQPVPIVTEPSTEKPSEIAAESPESSLPAEIPQEKNAEVPMDVAMETLSPEVASPPPEATSAAPSNDMVEPAGPVPTAESSPEPAAPSDVPVEISLEPAEERPPVITEVETPALPSKTEIPLAEAEVVQQIPQPIAEKTAETVPEPSSSTVVITEVTPPPVLTNPKEPEIAKIPEKNPAPVTSPRSEPATVPSAQVRFSVPVILNLDKGKYYIQLGAYMKADAVEEQIKKINKKYPLLVQVAGSTEKPVYRLMIGPLNEGESGALVSYFKKSGYKDAFVKKQS